MKVYLRVFLRGLAMVTLVSMNTVQLSSGHTGLATIGGFFISTLWWSSSSKRREDVRYAGVVYGFGAACGTAVGAVIAHWIGSLGR